MATLRIRKNSIRENLFLQRDDSWGERKTARTFSSQSACEKHADRIGLEVYGIF